MPIYLDMRWILLFYLLMICPSWHPSASARQKASPEREVVAFVYHRFGDERYPSTNVSKEAFREHLQFLKTHQYKVMTMGEAVAWLRQDGPHEKVAVISVDDGYESFYQNGLPLLKEFNYTASLFINTETVGAASYMNWNQIKECIASGLEIGNHTHSHPYFLNLAADSRQEAIRNEIEKSQSIFWEKLNYKPRVFAYPYGEFDHQMKSVVEEMGFLAAAAQNSGVWHLKSDIFSLPRFPMTSGFGSAAQFVSKARMRALKVLNTPPSGVLNEKADLKPALLIEVAKENLIPASFQCFVQGGECQLDVNESDGRLLVKATPAKLLSRRRTLTTITAKDTDGNWHWLSHVWVIPGKKE